MNKLLASNWIFWLISFPILVSFLFLTVFGTRILINPGKIEVTPCGDVVVFRNYPLVDIFGVRHPMIRYVTTITPLTSNFNDGYVCREDNGKGQRYNHDHGRGFGRWAINRYAEPCMEDPVGFAVDIKYTGLLFDIIPLRPINVSDVVIKGNGGWELCPFRAEEYLQ